MTTTGRTLDYGERGKVIVVADGDALASTAANLLATTIDEASSAGRRALVALSGGSTPKRMSQLFVTEPLASQIRWDAVDFFWGDERWVSLSDPESNAGEAQRGFLDTLPVPATHVHPFTTEGVSPEGSAADLEAVIRGLPPGGATPRFDLIFLGMGDDGHTASLFPGTAAIHETDRLVVSNQVDKLATTRLTFTPPLINAAAQVAFLVGGAGKADMLTRVLDGPIDVDLTPSQVVRPTNGQLTWIVDEAAAAGLTRNTDRG